MTVESLVAGYLLAGGVIGGCLAYATLRDPRHRNLLGYLVALVIVLLFAVIWAPVILYWCIECATEGPEEECDCGDCCESEDLDDEG